MQITAAHKRGIDQYYKELNAYQQQDVTHETAVRSAFQNLLALCAPSVNWILIPEEPLANGKRPDGTLRDTFRLPRGYWEAKDTRDDLATEIRKKISIGYPTVNTIFEDTRRAFLYQNNRLALEIDLTKRDQLTDLLRQFFSYTEPDIATFEAAVDEFKQRIPDLAQGLLARISEEHTKNARFVSAFSAFLELCRTSLNPQISRQAVDEMLVQHLLTERLFRTIFNNLDFINRNVIAAEIEKVIRALTSRAFNRNDFEKSLDRFYVAIEGAAKTLDSWTEKQHFLDTVYERFFQGFSVKQADTHGIVYTPQEIVEFMCASVEEVLQREFHTSLSAPGVQVLDPCTGTGNFIVNILRRISGSTLAQKYANDLFCNEIMLLPYYIASLNIEHAYYERTGEYQSFEGICFADTLELAEGQQPSLFVEENTERVEREKAAQIMVVIGNPPYNVGQMNENDNNKNRRYPVIDGRIKETYARDSHASNKNALSDAYVKFFRWAVDRLQGRDGIVCYVSNNSFVDQIAFDGMRKHLMQDFTHIYHLDLHGNVRKNPKLSGTTHNVFGIQVGVGITIAVRTSHSKTHTFSYYRVPEFWRKTEKLVFLARSESINGIDWQELQPDEKHTWLTEGIQPEFDTFLPLGTREARLEKKQVAETIFKTYSLGASTARDTWVYNFNFSTVASKIRTFIETYNSEIDRWRRRNSVTANVDEFVTYDDSRIKWSEGLKLGLQRNNYADFSETKIRLSLYRPFCKQWFFYDRAINERTYQLPLCFPPSVSDPANTVIIAGGYGRKHFAVLASDYIPNYNFYGDPAQCFPYYTYAEDGSNRRENITDWSLAQFQKQYGEQVTKRDIFHYVYGMLHHPQYRERYAENLKRELPRIPLLKDRAAFETCVRIGKLLIELHLHYEQAQEYPLTWVEKKDVPVDWYVKKMRLTPDKRSLEVNEWLTLAGIPQECFQYRLGNRSALEWVIDQYQVSTDKRSGITSDPNRLDDERYIVGLVGRVITVSVETVRLVGKLAEAITQGDWLNEEHQFTATNA
ncbi:MAG TPA: type ISP restriction/modification enzyme [Ktedonobacteraceae bacterium]|nr:type ISP restriction/modification enzyme [Ktedonobacteraceae bacterium]